MRVWRVVVLMGIVLMGGSVSGCSDLKPLQAQVDDLQSQMSQLRAETLRRTQSAARAAGGAEQEAAKCLSVAETAQLGVDITNERIDGMFKRAPPKEPKPGE
jgi:hypothetical protein